MNSRTTRQFRSCLAGLPPEIRRRARAAFRIWVDNPNHPGLEFKRLRTRLPVYFVRVGMDYRALGVLDQDTVVWFWIRSHAEYDRLIRGM